MSEFTIGTLAALSLIPLALACWLYMTGGRKGKWKRRFIASLVLSTAVCVLAAIRGMFNWYLTLTYPILALGFSMGYSANTISLKVLRRTLYALAVCSAGLIFCLTIGDKTWMILPLHVGVGLWSVWLGVKNPLEAAAEEVFVCVLLNLGLLMYCFVGR